MQQIQFTNKVKKQKTEKIEHSKKTTKVLHTPDDILKMGFLDVVGIYLKENHYEKVHGKMLLQKRLRCSSPTVPILSLSGTLFDN